MRACGARTPSLHAAQVVIDIGVHLELPVPPGTGWHDGQTWNAELAWEFLRSHSRYPDAILRFELDRYLGWPGQATSYKLGERIWLQAREDARQRQGTSFDLKEFHSQALACRPRRIASRLSLLPPEEALGQVAEHQRVGRQHQQRRRRGEAHIHRSLHRLHRRA
jgi:hypothetical protein